MIQVIRPLFIAQGISTLRIITLYILNTFRAIFGYNISNVFNYKG